MKTQRIESVDILRGFTITAMILVNTPGSWSHVYTPLLHAEWHGLTPTDLIFPFFLFIVGISIYFSYNNKSNSSSTYKKIIIRSLKLLGLGLFLNAFSPNYPFVEEIATMRFPRSYETKQPRTRWCGGGFEKIDCRAIGRLRTQCGWNTI